MTTGDRWARLVAAERAGTAVDRPQLLDEAVALGVDGVAPGVLGCSVTELDQDGGGRSAAASNSLAVCLDEAQFEAGDGPCLASARTLRPHRIDEMAADRRFSAFSSEAVRLGVQSSLSLPLSATHRPASLNLYAAERAVFAGQRCQAVAGLLARCTSVLLSPRSPAAAPSPRMAEALSMGRLVRQARQRLATSRDLSPAEAFQWLAMRSKIEQCSIVDVARGVLGNDGEEHK